MKSARTSNKRVESHSKGHRHVPTISNETERQSHQDVAAPCVKTPMIEGEEKSLLSELVIVLPGNLEKLVPIAAVIVDWLCNAKLVESNPNTRAKEHRKPSHVIEDRLLTVLPQLEVSEARKPHVHDKDGPDVLQISTSNVRCQYGHIERTMQPPSSW